MAITRARGGWWCDERTPPTRDGRRVRGRFATLGDVARALEGTPETPTQDLGPTLKEFVADFLQRHEPARNDPRTFGSNTKILLEHFGNVVRLGQITVPMVLDFRMKRVEKDGVKPHSVNRQVACLSSIYSRAANWGVWKGPNPCKEIEPFPEADPRERVFSRDEVKALLGAADGDEMIVAAMQIALRTGMRKGEVLALRWDWLHDGVIRVPGTVTKSGKPRPIPVDPTLQAILGALPRSGDSVLHRDGVPLDVEDLRRAWDRARESAKVENARWHDWRSTFASRLADKGVSLLKIATLLGHSDATISSKHYAHVDLESLRDALKGLDE